MAAGRALSLERHPRLGQREVGARSVELQVGVTQGEGAEHALAGREGRVGTGSVTAKAGCDLAHVPMIAGPPGGAKPAPAAQRRPMPW